MVSSVDGKTSAGGKASGLGSPADRQTMRNLRSMADAVMIGANTLRAEKMSLGLDAGHGGRQPLAVVVTAVGDVPLERNLVLGEGQRLLLVSTSPTSLRVPGGHDADVLIAPARGDGYVDLREVLKRLWARHRVGVLLVEGGPALNHSLFADDLVDELFQTVAPRLIGGPSAGILPGADLPGPLRLNLLSAHVAGSELFLRYGLRS
jgi:riboflavin-specific deaminase-like protein